METLSHQQETALLTHLGPHEAPKARLAALPGLRRGQVFGLRWEWIRWDEDAVMLHAFKRRPARGLPLAREAVQLLRAHWSAAGRPTSGWLFPDPHDASLPHDANGWYKYTFKRAVRAAGLSAQGITFHTLRHTWASRMITVGTHPRVLQQAGGWSSLALVERYTHPHDQATRLLQVFTTSSCSTATASCVRIGRDGAMNTMTRHAFGSSRCSPRREKRSRIASASTPETLNPTSSS